MNPFPHNEQSMVNTKVYLPLPQCRGQPLILI